MNPDEWNGLMSGDDMLAEYDGGIDCQECDGDGCQECDWTGDERGGQGGSD